MLDLPYRVLQRSADMEYRHGDNRMVEIDRQTTQMKNATRSASILCLALLGACGGGGQSESLLDNAQPTAVFTPVSASTCATLAGDQTLLLGDYAITTNTWGRAGISNFTECISATTLGKVTGNVAAQTGITARIDWNWPYTAFSVKAYPEIIYWPGGKALQPIALGEVGSLTVSHDVALSATGDYNLSYDLWVDSSALPGQWPHKAEVMIKLQGTWTDVPVVDTVSFDGFPYDVIVGPGGGGQWKLIVFQSRTALLKASIPIKPLIDYLVQQQHLLSTDYLSTIEFGSEHIQGLGSVTIHSYNVTR